MSVLRSFSIAAALAVFAVPATAATLTVNSAKGTWQTTDPGVTGSGGNLIQWGISTGAGKSGYQYSSPLVPFNIVDDEEFELGTFTHKNNPITGPVENDLYNADLLIEIVIAGVEDTINLNFSFQHLETDNLETDTQGTDCANGFAQGEGLNSPGCADRVTATFNEASSSSFILDGFEYTLSFSGFMYGGDLLDEFWTREQQDNSAQLIGSFDDSLPIYLHRNYSVATPARCLPLKTCATWDDTATFLERSWNHRPA